MAKLSGTVTDVTGHPIEGAAVEVHASGGEFYDRVSTDKGGRYAFDVPDARGSYAVRVTVDGAARFQADVQMSGRAKQYDITLTAASSDTTTATTTSASTLTTTTGIPMGTTLTDTTSTTTSTDTTSTDTTSSGTTSSGTTSSDTTSSGTTGSSVTSDTSSTTTGSSVTSATSGTTSTDSTTATTGSTTATTTGTSTTMTVAPPSGGGAAAPDFDALLGAVASTRFGVTPPVSVDEARQFRRLYTVGNYMLARVPGAITALNTALNTSTNTSTTGASTNGTTLPLQGKPALLSTQGPKIESILRRASEQFNTEQEVLGDVRSQFDLGTTAVANVNTEFKTLFKDFVGLCANDLLAVDPEEAKKNPFWDQRKLEELYNFLKRTRRALVRLVESMSVAGTLGSAGRIAKWSSILKDSIDVLDAVGQSHVGDDDIDRKHIWSIVAELNRQSRSSITGYVVHAREGGALLGDAIDVYEQIQATNDLQNESPDHLRALFFDVAKYKLTRPGAQGAPPRQVGVSLGLRENATLIQENWIPAWA